MTTRIDLSRLARPEIPGLVLTLDEAHAALRAYLETQHDWTIADNAADPAWRLTRALASREVLIRQQVADALAETSLAYATADRLDHIGVTYYGLLRLAGETDERYRERLAAAPERYAVGLSGPWYEGVARGVEGVSDARVTSPAPGAVTIYILADDSITDDSGDVLYADGIPTTALLDAVEDVVTAPETRQQTDTVTVSACTRQRYDVTVTLTLYAEPDSASVLTKARSALAALAARLARLGSEISQEIVAGACVDVAAVAAASIVIHTVSGSDSVTPVTSIAGTDSVALQARTLTVRAA